MKKTSLLLLASMLTYASVLAQEEGQAVALERFTYDKSFYFGGGVSLPFGENIGDYSLGYNFEAGFLKRTNRVFSIGASLSALFMSYDPEVTDNSLGNAYVGFIDDPDDPDYWEGYVIELEGGNISIISLALNLKLDFIPISDNSKIAIYGFAKPFVAYASRSDVSGNSTYLKTDDPDGLTNWRVVEEDILWGPDDYPALAAESTFTGGIFIGPGIEFMPSKKTSFFIQVPFGYTFPISYVSTSAYDESLDSYFDEEFPIVKEGFPSISFQAGLSFKF
jgi:hypothetical protein